MSDETMREFVADLQRMSENPYLSDDAGECVFVDDVKECATEAQAIYDRLVALSAEYRAIADKECPPVAGKNRDETMVLAGITVAAQAVYKKAANALDAILGQPADLRKGARQ